MAWYNFFSGSNSAGNSRKEGYQNSAPSSYNEESAARVTFDTAMTQSAFWASARLLSETVSSMPIRCVKKMPDGSRKIDTEYMLYRTINFQPNRYQTRTEFFETLMLNLVTDGNAYIEIKRTPRGIVSFMPLMSSQMEVELQSDGSIKYKYTDLNFMTRIISESNMWHIRLFGNGVVGMSPLAYARQALGVGLAENARTGKIAKNGGNMGTVLKTDKVLKPEQRTMFKNGIAKDIVGGDTVPVLEAGVDAMRIGLSPADMQLLESRRFSVEDIARFMGVPSVLINDTAGSTVWGSGIGELVTGFYKLNLKPYLERIESSMVRHLIPREDWGTYEIEFDFDSLLRADRQTRMVANSTAINSGQLTPNEARNMEGLPDKEGGDDIYLNGSLNAGGKQPEPVIKEVTEESDAEDEEI